MEWTRAGAELISQQKTNKASEERIRLGWREWVGLPALGIDRIKAKVDTGARTSALHAFEVEEFSRNEKPHVRFRLHPKQRNDEEIIECTAEVIDKRMVTDSGGHREERWVIMSDVHIGGEIWPAEITLTARDNMMFRMLLGRTAIANRAIVDPSVSYVQGKRLR